MCCQAQQCLDCMTCQFQEKERLLRSVRVMDAGLAKLMLSLSNWKQSNYRMSQRKMQIYEKARTSRGQAVIIEAAWKETNGTGLEDTPLECFNWQFYSENHKMCPFWKELDAAADRVEETFVSWQESRRFMNDFDKARCFSSITSKLDTCKQLAGLLAIGHPKANAKAKESIKARPAVSRNVSFRRRAQSKNFGNANYGGSSSAVASHHVSAWSDSYDGRIQHR